ncbi:hypothetical protein BHM03_00010937 [Ensete ventricosum]|nr:hypothetical protein BHM03_00010937 [Ensete ventricosum]
MVQTGIGAQKKVPPIEAGGEGRGAPPKKLQAVPRQLQFPSATSRKSSRNERRTRSWGDARRIPDDGRAEKALEVATAGEAESGDDLLGDGCATEDVAPLEDSDGEAGASEVGGGGEAVVAAADHDGVPLLVQRGGGGGGRGERPALTPRSDRPSHRPHCSPSDLVSHWKQSKTMARSLQYHYCNLKNIYNM